MSLLNAMSLDEDSWFASFLVQAFADDEYRRLLDLDHPVNRPTRTLIQLLARELSHLPARARRHRLEFAMITIVNRRMKSKAPVSLVTTTATNESSPELPNSRAEPPPRRVRRMETPLE